jgi:hypothetical protein
VENKDVILNKIKGQRMPFILFKINSILHPYRIKAKFEDLQGEFFGVTGNGKTGTDINNTITVYVNSGLLHVKSDELFYRFLDGFLQVLGHELVHRLQYHEKVSKEIQERIILKQQESTEDYLFSKQELMAFAWNIIEEFRYLKYSTEQIQEIMKISGNPGAIMKVRMPLIYKLYLTAFVKNNETKAKNQLHKYMYAYLQISV